MKVEGWDMPTTPFGVYREFWSYWGHYLNSDQQSRASRRLPKTQSERLREAEVLAADNGGVLPPSSTLSKLDKGLYNYIMRYPDVFSHLKSPPLSALERTIQRAEILAQNHGGLLPNRGWLYDHEQALYAWLLKRPECFQHIPQQPYRRNPHNRRQPKDATHPFYKNVKRTEAG